MPYQVRRLTADAVSPLLTRLLAHRPRSRHVSCRHGPLPNRYQSFDYSWSNHYETHPTSSNVTGSRLGGCGPVAVMRTGLHLGGGPGVMTGPDPAGRPPWAQLRPPPAPTGVLTSPGSLGSPRACTDIHRLHRYPPPAQIFTACTDIHRLSRPSSASPGPRPRACHVRKCADRGSRSGSVWGIRLGARVL